MTSKEVKTSTEKNEEFALSVEQYEVVRKSPSECVGAEQRSLS